MEPHLHEIELETSLLLDDDLAVERGVGWQTLAERAELGEVAEERTAVAAPETKRATVVLEHTAEAVPLRLVPDVRPGRERLDEERLLRWERDVRARGRDDLVGRESARGRVALAHRFAFARDARHSVALARSSFAPA